MRLGVSGTSPEFVVGVWDGAVGLPWRWTAVGFGADRVRAGVGWCRRSALALAVTLVATVVHPLSQLAAAEAEPNVVRSATGWLITEMDGASTALPEHLPRGSVDELTPVGTGLRVRGWTYDPDVPAEALEIHIYDTGPDGVMRPSFLTADQPRPDLLSAMPAAGANHGFAATVPTQGRGVHRVCAYAINVGSGASNPSLGCQLVLVGEPVGALDAVQIGAGTAFVEGWVVDPMVAGSAVTIAVYDTDSSGTRGYGPYAAPGRRDDVAAAFVDIGAGPLHGFSAPIPLANAGAHTLCAYALAEGGLGPNPLLGCRTVVVTAPTGQLDDVGVDGGVVRVRGWALDPGQPLAALEVHVYVRMAAGIWSQPGMVADQTRLDVAAAFPAAGGSHGYAASLAVGGHGAAEVCAYAIASGSGAGNQLLGCRSVAVP